MREGKIPETLLGKSRERIHSLLAQAPQNAVTALAAESFRDHRQAGALFSADIVEVV
jgi:hypothetical protein